MRKLFSSVLLVAALVPAVATAQRRATRSAATGKQEIGVDLGVAYAKSQGVRGGIQIGTPLDIRFGFRPRNQVMWEPRVSLDFSTVAGATTYGIAPGVNMLYSMTPGGHRKGMYLTGGAALNVVNDGTDSGVAPALNGAVGWRKPWGNGAWRYEAGLRYSFENANVGLPSMIEIGVRLGISLWH